MEGKDRLGNNIDSPKGVEYSRIQYFCAVYSTVKYYCQMYSTVQFSTVKGQMTTAAVFCNFLERMGVLI